MTMDSLRAPTPDLAPAIRDAMAQDQDNHSQTACYRHPQAHRPMRSNRSVRPARQHWTLQRIHRWVGLASALWLSVLGLTGFVLDHRDWRWLWQPAVPLHWLPSDIAHKSLQRIISLYRILPSEPAETVRIAAGRAGLWWTHDGGQHWSRGRFEGMSTRNRPDTRSTTGDSPQVLALVPDPQYGEQRLWAATDDGVWRSDDGGRHFQRQVLAGHLVSALTTTAQDINTGVLLGVVDRSRVFRLRTTPPARINWLTLRAPNATQLPNHITLSRFVHDLHFGRGIFTGATSLWFNDLTAISLISLPLTGLLFWILPRYWKRQRQVSQADVTAELPSATVRRHTLRWLYRLHAPLFGILTLVPVIYLSLTGILLDHQRDLGRWMHSLHLTNAWLPPVYALHSWQGEIFAIAGDPQATNTLSLGTRLGLFTSTDSGRHWQRDPTVSGFVWSLRRIGDRQFIGGMGSPNFMRQGNGAWQLVRHSGFMPSDVTALPTTVGRGSSWLWKSPQGLKAVNAEPAHALSSHSSPAGTTMSRGVQHKVNAWPLPPQTQGTWFDLIDGLHSGLLIHPQWKWVNDLFAFAALLLAITGLLRWRRRK